MAASYLRSILNIFTGQIRKGRNKYHMSLEDNTGMTALERIQMLEEELADAMMYCEHLKEEIRRMEDDGR